MPFDMDFLLDVGPTGFALGVPEWETTTANRKSNTKVLIILLLFAPEYTPCDSKKKSMPFDMDFLLDVGPTGFEPVTPCL